MPTPHKKLTKDKIKIIHARMQNILEKHRQSKSTKSNKSTKFSKSIKSAKYAKSSMSTMSSKSTKNAKPFRLDKSIIPTKSSHANRKPKIIILHKIPDNRKNAVKDGIKFSCQWYDKNTWMTFRRRIK